MAQKRLSSVSGVSRVSRVKRRTAPSPVAAEMHAAHADAMPGDELSSLVLKACLIARDSVFNLRDFLTSGSRMAFLAIKDCEKELDQIERHIDDELPGAISRVGEAKARQLLACLKFITDLERIGDLAFSAAMRLHSRHEKLPEADSRQLTEMASLLYDMLEQVHQGYLKREESYARTVLQADPEVDRFCHALFRRHLAETDTPGRPQDFDILLMAQALERIGDHAKNLAEELQSLAEGRSLRHSVKKLSSA